MENFPTGFNAKMVDFAAPRFDPRTSSRWRAEHCCTTPPSGSAPLVKNPVRWRMVQQPRGEMSPITSNNVDLIDENTMKHGN